MKIYSHVNNSSQSTLSRLKSGGMQHLAVLWFPHSSVILIMLVLLLLKATPIAPKMIIDFGLKPKGFRFIYTNIYLCIYTHIDS